jgi:hypothetical protein
MALMQHADIRLQLSLSGEPQKILTYWRGTMQDMLPTAVSVTILKMHKKQQRSPWWSDYDANFYFEAMTRTEKKRAELSISDRSLSMTAPEIETARHLTDISYDWISGRRGLPSLDKAIPNARLSLRVEGPATLVDVIEKFGDPEVVSGATVGAVFIQGEPRRPDVRWLPEMHGIDKTITLEEMKFFEGSLAEGQAAEMRNAADRVSGVFRKALNLRKARLNKRITEVQGYGKSLEINGRAITDDMIEGYQFNEIMSWLDGEKNRQRNPKDGIRSWRA